MEHFNNKSFERNFRNYENAYERSTSSNSRYNGRKLKKKTEINKAIMAVSLTGVVVFSGLASSAITKSSIENNNAIVFVDDEVKDDVDGRIDYYENLMKLTSDKDNRIENYYGRDVKNDIALVDYNVNNLVKHLISSAQTSESEMRCVIIAAYRIIDAPYLDEILNEAFLTAKDDKNIEENIKKLLENGTEGFLEKLSYEDWEDYQENERDNIKKLKALETYVGGIDRSGQGKIM